MAVDLSHKDRGFQGHCLHHVNYFCSPRHRKVTRTPSLFPDPEQRYILLNCDTQGDERGAPGFLDHPNFNRKTRQPTVYTFGGSQSFSNLRKKATWHPLSNILSPSQSRFAIVFAPESELPSRKRFNLAQKRPKVDRYVEYNAPHERQGKVLRK